VSKGRTTVHPTKMALHGSFLLEGHIFNHARDELLIAYRLIQPKELVPTIASLQERLETVRQGEIDRVRRRLGRLSTEQENAIESLTRGIINKVLQPAMTVLKTASAENDSTFFVEIVRRIFNLGEKRKHGDAA
jgi:glutamyl-tRNA reductase